MVEGDVADGELQGHEGQVAVEEALPWRRLQRLRHHRIEDAGHAPEGLHQATNTTAVIVGGHFEWAAEVRAPEPGVGVRGKARRVSQQMLHRHVALRVISAPAAPAAPAARATPEDRSEDIVDLRRGGSNPPHTKGPRLSSWPAPW